MVGAIYRVNNIVWRLFIVQTLCLYSVGYFVERSTSIYLTIN